MAMVLARGYTIDGVKGDGTSLTIAIDFKGMIDADIMIVNKKPIEILSFSTQYAPHAVSASLSDKTVVTFTWDSAISDEESVFVKFSFLPN